MDGSKECLGAEGNLACGIGIRDRETAESPDGIGYEIAGHRLVNSLGLLRGLRWSQW